jgi:hypothetical protein
MNGRLGKLVERLHEKSERGELAWRKGASGALEVSFPRYTVALDQLAKDKEITLTIYNDEGEVLDYITDNSLVAEIKGLLGGSYQIKLRETYNLARRKALGSDQAIDDLLRVLED